MKPKPYVSSNPAIPRSRAALRKRIRQSVGPAPPARQRAIQPAMCGAAKEVPVKRAMPPRVTAYAIKQNDLRFSNVSPLTIGIQFEGRTGPIGHWVELARQCGRSGTRQLKAWALAAGLIWYLPLPGRPALFAGYARASGGGDAGVDRGFRKTGLQDNEVRITGLANVRVVTRF